MLFYHGSGHRDYRLRPHPLRQREHWECAAILSGHAAPLMPEPIAYDSRPALWIFPPGHTHGWTSDRPCTVLIAHLASLPRLVADAAEARGLLRIALERGDKARLRITDRILHDLLARRPDAGEVAADLVRAECGRIALRCLPRRTPGHSDEVRVIKQALAWFEDHLHQGVGVDAVARAVAVSPAHLRRLAHRVAGRSPRHLLADARLSRARDLLRRTDASLDRIAEASGFASAAALSQAFHRATGQRPGAWRRVRRE